MADTVVPLSDLGEHPLHLLGNAIAFDHYCHLRHDIGAAVERAAALPHDPEVLAPTIEWMLAGLPQMCADALAAAPGSAGQPRLRRARGEQLVSDAGRPGGRTAVGRGERCRRRRAGRAHDRPRFRVVGDEALRLARVEHRRRVEPCRRCRARRDQRDLTRRAPSTPSVESTAEFDVDRVAGEHRQFVGETVDDRRVARVRLATVGPFGAAPRHLRAVVAPVGP